jgi:hypothetical protein
VRFAGHYFVDPFTSELRERPHGGGQFWIISNQESGEERELEPVTVYALADNFGRIEWFAGNGCGMTRDEYGRSVAVRVGARSVGQAIRAAHAAVIFKADPKRLEEW